MSFIERSPGVASFHFLTVNLPCASAYTSGERLREAAGLRIATLA
jgi:hypothetical protein